LFIRWPNLQAFNYAAIAYSRRSITYAYDTLNAFSGIIDVVSRSIEGGCLFATPEMFFDGMLLWQPSQPLERRQNVENSTPSELPSWSWISWKGELDIAWWMRTYNFIMSHDHTTPFNDDLNLDPSVVWYRRNTITDLHVRVKNTYYGYKNPVNPTTGERFKTDDSILPSGWTFRPPVPLASQPLATRKETWSPILEFRTQHLTLVVGSRLDDISSKGLSAGLKDANGLIVGGIRLNTKDSIEGVQCQLICISRMEVNYSASSCVAQGHAPELWNEEFIDSLWGDRHRATGKSDSSQRKAGDEQVKCIYNFYNVLWVRWEDGIAYREALGRVEQGYWDSAPTEELDVRLG
jgi:hypothetical protein